MSHFPWTRCAATLIAIALLAAAFGTRAATAEGDRPRAAIGDDEARAQLLAAVAAERARPRAPQLPRALFLAGADRRQATLSPDGRQLAWLVDDGRRRSVWLLATAGGEPRRLVLGTEATELEWTRDGRWLLLVAPRQLSALAVAGQAGSGAIAKLGGRTGRRLVGVDPTRPASALLLEEPRLAAGDGRRWRLWRVDVGGGEQLLHEDRQPIVDASIGEDGALAWLLRAEGEGHVLYRADGDALQAKLRLQKMRRCLLLGAAPDGGVWLNTNAGSDLSQLQRLDRAGRLHPVAADPRGEADLFEVVPDPANGQPRFVGFRSTSPQLVALSAVDAPALARLTAALPGASLSLQVGAGPGGHWLVRERGDRLRGERLWLFQPRTGHLRPVTAADGFHFGGRALARPDESAMARKWPVRWRASDGRRLHGFLSLPPGVDVARAPLVVAAHGGPFNLVRPDFSNDAQFLANRGYIVFQPNFRGSTGHGRDYLFAGGGDFGNGRVQQDIVDGVRWLLANDVGDPDRVGITGASFGGYTALLGVTFQPELFKVGVAAVPPADFGWVMREYLGAGQEMVPGVPMAASMRHLGLDPADAALARRLTAQSPVANAARMRRPLLLLAGGEDERVPIRGVTHYAAALRALGTDLTLFVDSEGDHGITDERSREAYFFLMESMLHRHLGGAAPQPADVPLLAHLRRNLRLAGPEFASLAKAGKGPSQR